MKTGTASKIESHARDRFVLADSLRNSVLFALQNRSKLENVFQNSSRTLSSGTNYLPGNWFRLAIDMKIGFSKSLCSRSRKDVKIVLIGNERKEKINKDPDFSLLKWKNACFDEWVF